MAAELYQNISHIILMLLLLGGSAFFSGAETALFNLSHRQIKLLQKSEHRLQNLAAKLLSKPSQLLGCLSFGNVTVNILFYAVASVLTVRVERQLGAGPAAICACLAFFVLIFFGEILPKSLAYTNSKSISVTIAMPAFLCLRIFTPVLLALRFLIIEPILRLLLGPGGPPKAITTSEFKLFIEQTQKRGLITVDENKLLTEVIELGFLKVRHVIQPRVDMLACAVADSPQSAREKMERNHLTKLPVYAGSKDNVVGMLWLRQLLLQPEVSLDKLIQQANFVPEQKTVESLLEFFRKTGTDTAIVVDEYGGIAGSVCLEDIAEELLGPIETTGGIEPIEQIGPLKYRLAGNLAVHDLAQAFGSDLADIRFSTIGGLVTAFLGRIPKTGDVAYLNNLKFTVERVRKRRIETLILTLEPIESNG